MEQHFYTDFFKFLTHVIDKLMATIQSLQDAIAAEKEQFTAAIAAKDAQIADLQNQLANAITPESLDPIQTGITEIVP